MRWDAVIFDLDGTLIRSAGAITRVMTATAEAHGRTVTPEEIAKLIGPPIDVVFGSLVPHLDVAGQQRVADQFYRDLAGTVTEMPAYPGIVELVRALAAADVRLGIATSTRRTVAVAALAELGLIDAFSTIQGAPEDDSPTKPELIGAALAELGTAPADTVMIGDRHHDVEGAREVGLAAIWVSWGNGQPDEGEHAVAAVDTADQLAAVLGLGPSDSAAT